MDGKITSLLAGRCPVSRSFEVNRLSKQLMAAAYQRLVPEPRMPSRLQGTVGHDGVKQAWAAGERRMAS
jgi:hypothetical protein